jgi:tetratricopeptide (TPR) repeat protein
LGSGKLKKQPQPVTDKSDRRVLADSDFVKPDILDTLVRRPESGQQLQAGRKFMDQGNYAEAVKIYNEYVQRNPMRYEGYRYRGDAYFMSKNYMQAITNYTISLSRNPRDAGALLNKAIAHYETRGYALAILDLEKAIKMEPNNGKGHYYLGLSKMKSNKGDRGCSDFNKADRLGYGAARAYLCGAGN